MLRDSLSLFDQTVSDHLVASSDDADRRVLPGKVLLLAYRLDSPAFRYRILSLVEPLQRAGWEVQVEQFPRRRYLLRTWERRNLLRWADVTVLQKINVAGPEALLFGALARNSIFDIDDAIYVRKSQGFGIPMRESSTRRRKFAATCRAASVVVAGNATLGGTALASGARRVEVLPTALDPFKYLPASHAPQEDPVLVWIGTAGNLIYLESLRPVLARLQRRFPRLRVRIVSAHFPDWADPHIEKIEWSSAAEADALGTASIGMMPLSDDEWSRGKCAFKLLQYMAAGLPCVASPVGSNCEAVLDGRTGYLAAEPEQWEHALAKLIESPAQRAQFGAAGRAHMLANYSMQTYQRSYLALIRSLKGR